MKKYIINLIALLLLTIWTSCSKTEDALTPSTENEGYVLPQGNHDYDTRIAAYFNKYGSYFLYKFSDKDAYWSPTGYKNSVLSGRFWTNGYEVKASDENYINQQLDLFETHCLNLYSEKFLKAFLPAKVLLCSEVDSVYNEYDFSTNPFTVRKATAAVGGWYSYRSLCISNGNSAVASLSTAQKTAYLAKVNQEFIRGIIEEGKLSPTNTFAASANYTPSPTSADNAYGKGIITPYYNGPSAASDWNLYIQAMVGCSETTLRGTPPYNGDMSFVGILGVKDINGMVKKRYDIVRNYFIENYGVDLQLIGNVAQPN